MVKINSEHKNGQTSISGLRVQRNLEKLRKLYAEREARNIRGIGSESVPNGDPPSLMLWGDE